MSLKGISIGVRGGSPRRPLRGLRGLTLVLAANLPTTVTDRRGRGLSNVMVTISNPTSGVPFTAFTDSQGNVLLNEDGSDPNPVTVQKENAFAFVDFTGGNSFTIILDPPPHK